MKVIWKHLLNQGADTTLELKVGAEILDVQWQTGDVVMWTLQDVNASSTAHKICCLPTGWDIIEAHLNFGALDRYLGTVQCPDGLVWHYFDGGAA